MADILATLTEALLLAAKAARAEAADALAVTGISQSIQRRGGKLEQAERSEATEIGLRVLMGGKQACVSASDTSARTIAQLAERAVAMARVYIGAKQAELFVSRNRRHAARDQIGIAG